MPFKYCHGIVIIKGLNFVAIFLSDVTNARRLLNHNVMNMKTCATFISLQLIDFQCSGDEQ